MSDRKDRMAEASTGLRPDRRLVTHARWIHRAVAIFLALTLLLDLVLLATVLLRMGSVVGVAEGRIEFVLDYDRAVPPILDAGISPGFVPISHFALWQSLLAAGLLALRLLPVLAVLHSLLALFGMYAGGLVFSDRNTRLVRRIAWALVAYALVPLVNFGLFVAAGMSRPVFELEMRQIDALVVATILFAVAHVVSFGCAIDAEREAFV